VSVVVTAAKSVRVIRSEDSDSVDSKLFEQGCRSLDVASVANKLSMVVSAAQRVRVIRS
jgi:hypothetical protein